MDIKHTILLDRSGKILDFTNNKHPVNSLNCLPIVADYYLWRPADQLNSAEKYKDQIKRVFFQDEVEQPVKVMLQDDIQRLNLIKKFSYGQQILEIGASDGSVSIKIAQQTKVKKIIAIDIRQSAIIDGRKLLKDLVISGEIKKSTADKITLKKCALENLPINTGQFDSVCAYEIFEHLVPWEMMSAFTHIYNFIKPRGKFFISVPNRFPAKHYEQEGRSRWKWFDHRNFFSQLGLELFLRSFFREVKFRSLYKNDLPGESIYLIAECYGKKI